MVHGIILLHMAGFLAVFTQGAETAGPALPAFPGAEGFGSTTPGGRGGQVLIVSTL